VRKKSLTTFPLPDKSGPVTSSAEANATMIINAKQIFSIFVCKGGKTLLISIPLQGLRASEGGAQIALTNSSRLEVSRLPSSVLSGLADRHQTRD